MQAASSKMVSAEIGESRKALSKSKTDGGSQYREKEMLLVSMFIFIPNRSLRTE